ncbi:hypothetical protein EUGRSUZ_D01755 [Eucalyptus grandis]|uniref:Uncharacterized protein n=2 Tax=Eucalyptus grandis TaxID=71139 RepID=A0ACC3L6U9_EUCGR|nr:hypothetical protein EUGRSUZ_D01755 [Eucalyptus grandis]
MYCMIASLVKINCKLLQLACFSSDCQVLTSCYLIFPTRIGYILMQKLKEMVLALLGESDLTLSDDVIDTIVCKAITEADTKDDGKIDREEWREFVAKNPSLIKNMTLPYLKEVTLAFPSFVMSSEVQD